jgi:hypothetical protein
MGTQLEIPSAETGKGLREALSETLGQEVEKKDPRSFFGV